MKLFLKKIFLLFFVVISLSTFSFHQTKAGEAECETSKNGICKTRDLLSGQTKSCPKNYELSPSLFGCTTSYTTEEAFCCIPNIQDKPTTPACKNLEGYCAFVDLNSGQTNPCVANFGPAPNSMNCPVPTHTGSKEVCCIPKNNLDIVGICQKAGGNCAKSDPGEKYALSTNEKENKDCQIQNGGKCYFLKKCSALSGTCFSGECPEGYKALTGSSAQEASDSCKKNAGSSEQASCCISKTGSDPTLNGGGICPEYGEGLEGGFLFFKGSLVPCGRNCDDPGTDIDETQTCTLCHFIILIKRGYDLVFAMLIIVSLVTITAGGVIYIASAGNPKMTGIAKGLIVKTLVGFGLFLVAWLIIFTILRFISANTSFLGDGEKWWEFECQTESIFDTGVSDIKGQPVTTVPTPDEYEHSAADISNIPQQKADASNELNQLLTCMQPLLPTEAKVISSVSDSQGMENCAGDKHKRPPCAHSKNSCHYGGTACTGKSYAVDLKYPQYETVIRQAAKQCNTSGSVKFLKEGNHIHISVNGKVCGCDNGLSAP